MGREESDGREVPSGRRKATVTEHEIDDEGAARGLAAEHLDLGTEVGVGHVGQQPRVDVGVGGNRRERLIEVPPMSSGSASDSLAAPTPAVIQSPERYARHRLRPTRFLRAAALRKKALRSRTRPGSHQITQARRKILLRFRDDVLTSDDVTMCANGCSISACVGENPACDDKTRRWNLER